MKRKFSPFYRLFVADTMLSCCFFLQKQVEWNYDIKQRKCVALKKSTRILIKVLFSLLSVGLFVLSALSVPGIDSLLFLFVAAVSVPIEDWQELWDGWLHSRKVKVIILAGLVALGLVLGALEVPNSEKRYDLEEFIKEEIEGTATGADTVIADQTVIE